MAKQATWNITIYKFDQLIYEKTEENMSSYVLETLKKQQIEEAIAEKNLSIVEKLIVKLGLSDKQAADVAEVSITFVKKVRKELAAKK